MLIKKEVCNYNQENLTIITFLFYSKDSLSQENRDMLCDESVKVGDKDKIGFYCKGGIGMKVKKAGDHIDKVILHLCMESIKLLDEEKMD